MELLFNLMDLGFVSDSGNKFESNLYHLHLSHCFLVLGDNCTTHGETEERESAFV